MSEFVNSCLNYSGNKYKLLPQLLPRFPDSFNNFIDLFAGGAVVGVNVADQYKLFNYDSRFILNDKEETVINLFKFLKEVDIPTFVNQTENLIKEYGFSNTKNHSYKYYNLNSSKGLSSFNKEPYLKLRKDYNQNVFNEFDNYIAFYVLIIFGFNNQIRFNSKGEFNLPVGKRDFNSSMEKKLVEFTNLLTQYNFEFKNKDFREINDYQKNDFIYADPPYRISTASYNENGGWSLKDDLDLFEFLNNADKIGAKFALSNVLTHKGVVNEGLKKWSINYNTTIIGSNYNNSNYQSTAKQSKTIEVLITNY